MSGETLHRGPTSCQPPDTPASMPCLLPHSFIHSSNMPWAPCGLGPRTLLWAGPWQRHGDEAKEKEDKVPFPPSFPVPFFPIPRPSFPMAPLPSLSPEGARFCARAAGGQAGGCHEDPPGPGGAGPSSHPGEKTPETGSWGWGHYWGEREASRAAVLRSGTLTAPLSLSAPGPAYGTHITFPRPLGAGRRAGGRGTCPTLGLCQGLG